MLDMAKKAILPAVIEFANTLAQTVNAKKAVSADINCEAEEALLKRISALSASMYKKIDELDAKVCAAKDTEEAEALAMYYKESVIPAMSELRVAADELETIVDQKYWPFPTYGKLLFGVN